MENVSDEPSNGALWGLYHRLTQQARRLEFDLATPEEQIHLQTHSYLPQCRNPTTSIPQPSNKEDIEILNQQSTLSLGPDQRQVTLVLSSSPADTTLETPSRLNNTADVILLSSSSISNKTPVEQRIPVQRIQGFSSNLQHLPTIPTTHAEVLEISRHQHGQHRILVTRATVDAYRQLIIDYMGISPNIYTDYTLSPDTSNPSYSELDLVDDNVLSLITPRSCVYASVVESTAYAISDLGLATGGNYYLGRFDDEGRGQQNRARFRETTWVDLVTKVGGMGESYDTTYLKVCDYLRTRRKLVMFINLGKHATVLTLVYCSKTATFFDTMSSNYNQFRARVVCSSVIRSVFNETTIGWNLQFASVTQQDKKANNCGIHSLLRIRDELEDNNSNDTSERSANTLRLYLALRFARGDRKYPMLDIIK